MKPLKECPDCGAVIEERDYDELTVRSIPCVCSHMQTDRWNIMETEWVCGGPWYLVIDSRHEHNTYETPDFEIAKAFKAMMENWGKNDG